METETLLAGGGYGGLTQSVEAVVELLRYLERPQDPLPEVVDLGTAKLVLSNKKDVYYLTTPETCSCPASYYKPGQKCKHQRKYFAMPRGQTIEETLAEHGGNLPNMPASYQRMVRAAREEAEAEPLTLIKKAGFRPVYPGE